MNEREDIVIQIIQNKIQKKRLEKESINFVFQYEVV